ncbi:MAG: amino acid permease [Spirochaetales bacterium]|nr:MAG: amino acid permease [Spirochaetales bacterium]
MKLFNTFSGVFVPSYEAILGAVLFLLLPVLTSSMGLWKMLLIVLLSNTATLATAFSIADCTTNLERIGAGGMYAMGKRSLGIAFGGSIGIQLFLAQAASIGFYAIGFSDPLQRVVGSIPLVQNVFLARGISVLMQKQIIASFIAFVAFISALRGADFIVKVQIVIFIVLTFSILAIMMSPLFRGITFNGLAIFSSGSNTKGLGWNLGFWGAFAAFFPAVTGIDAGVGMSGQLQNPRKALSKGTFVAIGVTAAVYIILTVLFSFIMPEHFRSTDGQLVTALQIFSQVPVLPWIIFFGILFATGSSALSYFMTAPRTAQALARDKVLPKFLWFLGRAFRKCGDEPRWATVLVFVIVLPIIWSGDITFSSMVVGICFLVVYGWINFAAFLERISGNPSFRPTSRGHWAVSLYGFVVCMTVIALFNMYIGLGVLVSQVIIFSLILKYRAGNRLEGVWWGSIFQVLTWGLKRIRKIIQGSKNWRPIVSIFCFGDRRDLAMPALAIGTKISSYKGLTMVNILMPGKNETLHFPPPEEAHIIQCEDAGTAILSILQSAAPGGLQPNTVLFPLDLRLNLASLIVKAIELGKNVLLYKHGLIPEPNPMRIDVWWKGEENGNFMALLSYIINQSETKQAGKRYTIRVIRKLHPEEDPALAQAELTALMAGARLGGEVLVLPDSAGHIRDTIKEYSGDASLILIGMPGKRAGNLAKMFSLDRLFFSKELHKYDSTPPILFVKAAQVHNLLEE